MPETAHLESVRYRVLPLAGVEAMSATTSRSFPRHTHDEFGVGLVDAGGHGSCSGRGHVEAGPGTFISVNPGEVHDGHALGRRARSWRILYFDPTVLDGLFADIQGRDARFEFTQPVFRDDGLLAAFESAFACASGDSDLLACESVALELIAKLRPHSTSTAMTAARASPDVRRARDRMEADPAAALSLETLARECSLGRFQFLRAFRQAFGLPPHAYLLQRRLALARRLLRARMPLAEIAAAAGFSDQSHLTRCFTRQYGLPPGRYSAAIR